MRLTVFLDIRHYYSSLPLKMHTHTLCRAPKPDLRDLVVLPVFDWFSLGDQLNIALEKLLVIRNSFHHDPPTCKRKMFQCWLDSISHASKLSSACAWLH